MRALLLAVLLVPGASPARAAFQKATGGNASEFLDIGAGARALGMAEAFSTVAEGPDALYWNPAGLAKTRSLELSYTRAELNQFFHHDYAAVAVPARLLRGALGLSYTRLSQESLTLRTNANVEVGEFAPHSDALSIGYATSFDLDDEGSGERDYFGDAWAVPNATRSLRVRDEPWRGSLLVGAALKLVAEQIHQRSSRAVAFDGGALFRPADYQSFCLGFAFRNLGGRQRYTVETENLPAQFDFGLSWDARSWKSRWLAALETAVPVYGAPYVKAGVEYSKPVGDGSSVAIRGGYKTQLIHELGPISGVAFGLGLKVKKFSFDFGFQPTAALGQVYRFSVGLKW